MRNSKDKKPNRPIQVQVGAGHPLLQTIDVSRGLRLMRDLGMAALIRRKAVRPMVMNRKPPNGSHSADS
jgi:hypothetical protein